MTAAARRRACAVACALALGWCVPGPAAAATTTVAASGNQVTAEVMLKVQADIGAIRTGTRHDRVIRVVRALRSTATAEQGSLLTLLRTRRAQGAVTTITPLWLADAVVVTATPAVLAEVAARSDVRAVLPERLISAPQPTAASKTAMTSGVSAEQGIEKVDAPAMWGQGYLGQGAVVASLDTGVDVTHPDLASQYRGGTDSWFDPYGEHPTTPTDISGHGTQTMGVIVGGSAGGTAVGVAPNAHWIAAKIFNDRGVATTTAIHQAFQWVLDPDNDPSTADAPAIVNNSWDDQTTSCSTEFQPDLAALRAAGIIPVFAAGNDGPMDGSILNPANLPDALAVGGTDESDVIEASSSRGPSSCGQPVAPAMTAPDTTVRTTDLYGGYVTATGTSLAAPHVSGALALLLSARPNLTADQLQTALSAGAVDLGAPGPDQTYGAGRLDALASYQSLSASPDFSLAASPTAPTVTAGGTAHATLTVGALSGFGGDVDLAATGLPGSVGTTSISPATVTGSGPADLALATVAGAPPGTYPVTVTGTSGALTHTVTVSLTVTSAGAPDFTMAASPMTRTIARGKAAAFQITLGAVGGFTGKVKLSRSGIPLGATTNWTTKTVTPPRTVTLKVTTTTRTPRGTYTIVVTGGCGPTSHQVTLTLVVR